MPLLPVGKDPCYSPFKKRPQPTYITHRHCRIFWALMLTQVRRRQHVTVISFGSRVSSLGYNVHETCFSRFLLTRYVLKPQRLLLFSSHQTQNKMVISRDTAILPRKLDWMVTDRADDLKTIMSDNATFIQFPALGSSTSLITVYGDHRVNIQRTIRSIMQLVSYLRLWAVIELTRT
jgi:hypothetical protein